MPRLPSDRNPKLRRHASGVGVVTLSGTDHYTSPHPYGSAEAEGAYLELIGRWNANGRKALPRARQGPLTVGGLTDRYEAMIRATYRKRGEPTSYAQIVGRVCRTLKSLYGSLAVGEFGRTEFRTVRNHWLNTPSRRGRPFALPSVNEMAENVRRLFRWAVQEEIIPGADWMRQEFEPKLRRGRCTAPVPPPVPPAPIESLRAVAEAVRHPVRAMMLLQLFTGMRPGEVCGIRACYLDRSEPVWAYRVPPEINKNEHRGQERIVDLGPQAQDILGPFLEATKDDPTAPLFTTKWGKPFSQKSYATVIAQKCKRLGVVHFSPNQIRHLAATEVRAAYGDRGLEMAGAILGHRSFKTTEIYAVRRRELAAQVAAERG